MSWNDPVNYMGCRQESLSCLNSQGTGSHYSSSLEESMLSSSNFSTSSRNSYERASYQQDSSPYGKSSPAGEVTLISILKNQSDEELKMLLNDKEAYTQFFSSLPDVKKQHNVPDEVEGESLQLARGNLEKEPCLSELRNQCMILRTTELPAVREKLKELERQKEETLKFFSPESVLQKLQDTIEKTDLESKALQKQLLDNVIDLSLFLEKYKSLRMIYHQCALIHLSAKTNL